MVFWSCRNQGRYSGHLSESLFIIKSISKWHVFSYWAKGNYIYGAILQRTDNAWWGEASCLSAMWSQGSWLDGMSSIFYHHCWDIISNDLIVVVLSFFENGCMPKNLNHTHLVLIPKASHPESIKRFSLIGLYNFIYKVIVWELLLITWELSWALL